MSVMLNVAYTDLLTSRQTPCVLGYPLLEQEPKTDSAYSDHRQEKKDSDTKMC